MQQPQLAAGHAYGQRHPPRPAAVCDGRGVADGVVHGHGVGRAGDGDGSGVLCGRSLRAEADAEPRHRRGRDGYGELHPAGGRVGTVGHRRQPACGRRGQAGRQRRAGGPAGARRAGAGAGVRHERRGDLDGARREPAGHGLRRPVPARGRGGLDGPRPRGRRYLGHDRRARRGSELGGAGAGEERRRSGRVVGAGSRPHGAGPVRERGDARGRARRQARVHEGHPGRGGRQALHGAGRRRAPADRGRVLGRQHGGPAARGAGALGQDGHGVLREAFGRHGAARRGRTRHRELRPGGGGQHGAAAGK